MAIRYIFTAIPNKILEKILGSDLSKRQKNIIEQVCRMTFGCHVFIATYKNSDFAWSGVRGTVIKKELEMLKELNVIRLDEELGLIGMNPRIEEWKCKPNGNTDDLEISQIRNEVLSKQLKAIPVLRILAEKTFDEIRAEPRLKETLKKLNTGRISTREIQEVAVAYGPYSASARALARKYRTEG